VVTVSLLDGQGRWVPTAHNKIFFSVSGPGRILGVGNGDPGCHEPDCRVEMTETIRTSDWVPPVPAKSKGRYVFETTFDLPTVEPGEFVSILLGALGPKPKVMLNNHEIPGELANQKSDTEFWMDPSKLQKSRNVLRLEAQPALAQVDSETLGRFRPAFLRVVKMAAPWSRSAFNGLAQVIVQSDGKAGEIILEAKGEGLKPAHLVLKAEE
jgi:beta-galactosidase